MVEVNNNESNEIKKEEDSVRRLKIIIAEHCINGLRNTGRIVNYVPGGGEENVSEPHLKVIKIIHSTKTGNSLIRVRSNPNANRAEADRVCAIAGRIHRKHTIYFTFDRANLWFAQHCLSPKCCESAKFCQKQTNKRFFVVYDLHRIGLSFSEVLTVFAPTRILEKKDSLFREEASRILRFSKALAIPVPTLKKKLQETRKKMIGTDTKQTTKEIMRYSDSDSDERDSDERVVPEVMEAQKYRDMKVNSELCGFVEGKPVKRKRKNETEINKKNKKSKLSAPPHDTTQSPASTEQFPLVITV